MKKLKRVISIILIASLVISLFSIVYMLFIRRKEVDITIKYSLNGEEFTISETAVCKFDHISWNNIFYFFSVGNLADIQYAIYIPGKTDPQKVLAFPLLDLSETDTTEEFGYDIDLIAVHAGSAEFYLFGEGVPPYTDTLIKSYSRFLIPVNRMRRFANPLTAEEEEYFNIELISFDYKIR